MNPQQLVKTSFPQLRDEVRDVLALAAEYGINWKNTRFDRYFRAIETAAEQEYPRLLTTEGNHDAQKLFWEAASQTQQLINSSTFWASQDQAVITRKLADIVKGRDLPPAGAEADHPRNTLVELTSAALLYRHYFDVQLSSDSEDVLATIDGTEPFAVECKRPATRGGLENNLKAARKELRRRCANGGKQGLAVIVADRVLQVTGAMPTVQTVDQLVTIVDRKLEHLARDITEMVQCHGLKLFPVTKLGAIVLVGTVFVGDLGMPFTPPILTRTGSISPSWSKA